MSENVGFIGLGAMGAPMAQNLIAAGFALKVHNRTAQKADPLVARGAQLAQHPQDAVTPGGIAVTMLADDRALEAVAMGERSIARRLAHGGVHISMSTISPHTARAVAEDHQRHGCAYVAAPVFGRPEAAAARKLWIVASGSQAAKDRVRPILDAMGQGVFDLGERPEAAHVAKLAGNFLIASAIEAMGEAFALVEKSGVERTAFAELMARTIFACPLYQAYAPKIALHQYTPAGFRLPLGLKDVQLAIQTAGEARVPMPIAGVLRDRFLAALAKGRDEMDWSAIALGASEDAGLK